MKYAILILVAEFSALTQSLIRFDNYQVYRVTPETTEQLQALHHFQKSSYCFDFWTDVYALGHPVDIMVAPYQKCQFEDFTKKENLKTEVLIVNVQELIERQITSTTRSNGFDCNSYHTLEEIYDWLRSLSTSYPEIVTVIVGGHSSQGKEILGVKISFRSGNKGVFLEGGIHAREWISPATVTFIANELLTSSDPAVREVAQSRYWYVFPCINPDGYVFTRINRLWRKTTKFYGLCFGVDGNRNWGYHWMDGGASSFSCDETFAGSSPFSEIETRSLSEYISTIAGNLDTYLSFHSYSQLLLIPFGHSGHEVPANNDELLAIGNNAAAALAVRYGTQYNVGNIPDILYVASGGSSDWVLATYRHIRLVYSFELRDTGQYGFLLPPEQIIPTGEETLDAVVSMIQQADASQ